MKRKKTDKKLILKERKTPHTKKTKEKTKTSTTSEIQLIEQLRNIFKKNTKTFFPSIPISFSLEKLKTLTKSNSEAIQHALNMLEKESFIHSFTMYNTKYWHLPFPDEPLN